MENVKKFYDALAKDEDMQKKANSINDKYKGKQPDEETAIADIIAFASAEGYSFTAEEFMAHAEQSNKMSDDELGSVAGGSPQQWSDWCNCIAGGAGTNDEQDIVCVCVIGGGGKADSEGWALACAGVGTTMGGF